VTVVADVSYSAGTLNRFTITMTELRPDLCMVTWIEEDTGNTVTYVQDYENLVTYTNITDLASRAFGTCTEASNQSPANPDGRVFGDRRPCPPELRNVQARDAASDHEALDLGRALKDRVAHGGS